MTFRIRNTVIQVPYILFCKTKRFQAFLPLGPLNIIKDNISHKKLATKVWINDESWSEIAKTIHRKLTIDIDDVEMAYLGSMFQQQLHHIIVALV